MKKSKRLLALLLSVMLIMGAIFSVPFTVSAKTVELEETGATSLKFSEAILLGDEVKPGQDYYSIVDPEVRIGNPVYTWFDAEEVGHYVLYIKNNGMTTGSIKMNVAFTDNKDTELASMTVADGEEQELSLRIEKTGRYYIRLFYDYKNAAANGNIDLKLNSFADIEPDKMDPSCTVKSGVFFTGSVDAAIDKDYVFVHTADKKKYSITLENRNETATAFKAEVYDSNTKLVGTVTTEEENPVTLELPKPTSVTSYYVCVTGIDGAVGDYGFHLSEVKPVSVEVPLNEEYYDSITGYDTEGGRDYLKFTTIDKDAYYTITVKNINITTHSWAADNEVQADVLNANDEKLGNIYLTKGQEKSTTLKLEPNTTYYMRVYNNYLPDTNGGNYKVQISYVLDPDKNEMENATDWKLEEKYYGNIAAYGDKDWFKITTNEETDYTFTLKNINISTHSWSDDRQFRGVIYNDKSENLASMHMTAGKESSVRVDLDPNTEYYIAIWDPQGTTGDYSFDLSVTVIIDEEAVGMANATELKYGEEHYDSITNWDGDNKFDYLKFTTLKESAYYTIYAKNINIPTHSWSSDNQVQVKILNEHKEEQGRFTLGPESDGSATLLLEPDTTYYIRINNNENNGGNYKALVTYVLDPEPNVMENGKLLRIAERYYGSIAASGDKDYFKITTTDKTDYILYLKNINIPTHSWSSDNQFRVVLYNKYSEILGEILATNGNEGNINITLEPNTTYYLGIWDPDNTKGDYNVILSDGMLLGDVTLDDKVNIKDATAIQKNIAKLLELDAKQTAAADVTADGKVNIKDATAIQKFIAKIETEYKTGQLILSEIEYNEPATEATVPTEIVTTTATEATEVPVTTNTLETEPTEIPVTTIVTEPVETTEVTVPETTASEEVTEPVPTETLSQLDTLKALNEEAKVLLEENKAYADELPLEEDSTEMETKKELGYYDYMGENLDLNEYEKLSAISRNVSSYLDRGYQFSDDHSEYISKLTKAIEWFEHYVNEVHSAPALLPKTIYFKNTLGWKYVNIYCWNENGDEMNWPGVEMNQLEEDIYSYEVASEFTNIIFNTTEKDGQYSVEIDLTEHESHTIFELTEEFEKGYKYKAFVYEIPVVTLSK
ncbi:MAG: starch-binding protein [Ruminococcus sp.]|nr:starch-binding protein [Ruminococcus sp.]